MDNSTLMRLPRELRDTVYEHLFTLYRNDQVIPVRNPKFFYCDKHTDSCLGWNSPTQYTSGALRTCRQLRQEYLDRLLSTQTIQMTIQDYKHSSGYTTRRALSNFAPLRRFLNKATTSSNCHPSLLRTRGDVIEKLQIRLPAPCDGSLDAELDKEELESRPSLPKSARGPSSLFEDWTPIWSSLRDIRNLLTSRNAEVELSFSILYERLGWDDPDGDERNQYFWLPLKFGFWSREKTISECAKAVGAERARMRKVIREIADDPNYSPQVCRWGQPEEKLNGLEKKVVAFIDRVGILVEEKSLERTANLPGPKPDWDRNNPEPNFDEGSLGDLTRPPSTTDEGLKRWDSGHTGRLSHDSVQTILSFPKSDWDVKRCDVEANIEPPHRITKTDISCSKSSWDIKRWEVDPLLPDNTLRTDIRSAEPIGNVKDGHTEPNPKSLDDAMESTSPPLRSSTGIKSMARFQTMGKHNRRTEYKSNRSRNHGGEKGFHARKWSSGKDSADTSRYVGSPRTLKTLCRHCQEDALHSEEACVRNPYSANFGMDPRTLHTRNVRLEIKSDETKANETIDAPQPQFEQASAELRSNQIPPREPQSMRSQYNPYATHKNRKSLAERQAAVILQTLMGARQNP